MGPRDHRASSVCQPHVESMTMRTYFTKHAHCAPNAQQPVSEESHMQQLASGDASEGLAAALLDSLNIGAAMKGRARLLPGAPEGLEGIGRTLAAACERARVGERARRLVRRPQRHERQAQPRKAVQHLPRPPRCPLSLVIVRCGDRV